MKLLWALLVLVTTCSAAFHDRKILVSHFASKSRTLADLRQVQTQVRERALKSLHSLPSAIKSDLAQAAVTASQKHYPVKTAHDFMEFFRNGNRAHYQTKLTDTRGKIGQLVVGHLLDREHNLTSTKYIDDIINGVWILAEESTWCYPAHLSLQGGHDHLPTPGHLAIDLNAGEVAKFLGWVRLLVGDQLDSVAGKVVTARIDHELRTRIFEGYLTHNYGWEAFTESHHTNNWNIWVNGNILKSAMFSLADAALFNRVLNKTLYSADYFLDGYGEDGGCDEGPAYWRQAGGRLIEFLESLEVMYGESARSYFAASPLIKRIGDYAYKMQIHDRWFVNFADAVPVLTYPPSLLLQYGNLFDDGVMRAFAAQQLAFSNPSANSSYYSRLAHSDLNEFFDYIGAHAQLEKLKPESPLPELVWLPDIQVVTARTPKSVTTAGRQLFVAAKAGTNHENHNHNDVGSLVLFQDGNPVLIDVGVGTYTAKTFGAHRYELFYMQSQYHNCPTINGVAQKAGGAFSSKDTKFAEASDHSAVHFVSDIAGAYPTTSHAKHWTRAIDFNRSAATVRVRDEYELAEFVAPQQLHFMLHESVVVDKMDATGLRLHQSGKVNMAMAVDLSVFDWKVEKISLDNDHHLTGVWGESVQRLTLTTNAQYKLVKGHFEVTFAPL